MLALGASADKAGGVMEPPEPDLSERSRAILEFERTWWQTPGAKEVAIRERFGFSGTKYYRLLNELIDDPIALGHDPLTVRRLRRRREQLRRSRVQGHPAGHPGSGSRP
jgi:Protein of unknown function (DUF3263)